jgi:hypothetical protein
MMMATSPAPGVEKLALVGCMHLKRVACPIICGIQRVIGVWAVVAIVVSQLTPHDLVWLGEGATR